MKYRLRLEGKIAVVTGAGSRAAGIGNGRAAAILFAREGAKVLLVDTNTAAAEETLAMIRDEGGEAEVFRADVTSIDDCRAMVEKTMSRWGRLDILDNNVGIRGLGDVIEVTEKDWDQVMMVNIKSMMLTSKFVVPVMAAGGGGSIINISSVAAFTPRSSKPYAPYAASKGAVISLTRAMAIDHAKHRIRVNCIAPGAMYTPMVSADDVSEELRDRYRRASPLGIEGTGWDIGHAALFLASDEARFITGIVLVVDGGLTISSSTR